MTRSWILHALRYFFATVSIEVCYRLLKPKFLKLGYKVIFSGYLYISTLNNALEWALQTFLPYF